MKKRDRRIQRRNKAERVWARRREGKLLRDWPVSGLFEEFSALPDGGLTQFSVNAAGVVHQLNQFDETLFGSGKRFLGSAVFLIAEILGKRCPRPAQAEAPSLKGGGLVGEAGEVAFRFHGRYVKEHMACRTRQANLKVEGNVRRDISVC